MSTNPSMPNPKQIFDAAMVVLEGKPAARTAQTLLQRHRALRSRAETPDLLKKRTLTEAADALAKLWQHS